MSEHPPLSSRHIPVSPTQQHTATMDLPLRPPNNDAPIADLRYWLQANEAQFDEKRRKKEYYWEIICGITGCTMPSTVQNPKEKATTASKSKRKRTSKSKGKSAAHVDTQSPEPPVTEAQQQQPPLDGTPATQPQQPAAPVQGIATTAAMDPQRLTQLLQLVEVVEKNPNLLAMLAALPANATAAAGLEPIVTQMEPSHAPATIIDLTGESDEEVTIKQETEPAGEAAGPSGQIDWNDAKTFSEAALRLQMQELGLPIGSRADMTVRLREYYRSGSNKGKAPDVLPPPFSLEEVLTILQRKEWAEKSLASYKSQLNVLHNEGLWGNLCHASRTFSKYRRPTNQGTIRDTRQMCSAVLAVFKQMTPAEKVRFLRAHNETNTTLKEAVAATDDMETLMKYFVDLRDEYGVECSEENLRRARNATSENAEMSARQKEQAIMPSTSILNEHWPQYKDTFFETCEITQPSDVNNPKHLKKLFECGHWAKADLLGVRNDMCRLRTDNGVIGVNDVVMLRASKSIAIRRLHKVGGKQRESYETILQPSEKTWEMLLALSAAQKKLGRDWVFCQQKENKPQDPNYYGKSFSKYFGKRFGTAKGKYSLQVLRGLRTAEENLRDGVPLPHQIPHEAAKRKAHGVFVHTRAPYHQPGKVQYALESDKRRKLQAVAEENSGEDVDGDDEEEEGGGSEQRDSGEREDGMEVDEDCYEAGPSRDPYGSASLPPLPSPLNLSIFEDGSGGEDIAPVGEGSQH